MQFDYEADSVEYAIEQHIRGQLASSSCCLDNRQIIVKVDDGKAIYDQRRGYVSVCTETLTVHVIIASDKPLARIPIIRAFPRVTIETGGFKLKQEYYGHKFRNYAEAYESKGTTIQLKYEHDIKEEG